MKCPKCWCENKNSYLYCTECGNPLKNKTHHNYDNIKYFISKNKIFLIAGCAILIIILGIINLDIGAPEPGHEAIVNIVTSTGNESYYLHFNLVNVPKDANKYFVKVDYYDNEDKLLMTRTADLRSYDVEDHSIYDVCVDAYHDQVNISKCIIEITSNKGEIITSAEHQWLD